MSSRNAAAPPDLVTLANLHAALDSMLEVEALIDRMRLAGPGVPMKPRLAKLAGEMRALLTQLLATPATR